MLFNISMAIMIQHIFWIRWISILFTYFYPFFNHAAEHCIGLCKYFIFFVCAVLCKKKYDQSVSLWICHGLYIDFNVVFLLYNCSLIFLFLVPCIGKLPRGCKVGCSGQALPSCLGISIESIGTGKSGIWFQSWRASCKSLHECTSTSTSWIYGRWSVEKGEIQILVKI